MDNVLFDIKESNNQYEVSIMVEGEFAGKITFQEKPIKYFIDKELKFNLELSHNPEQIIDISKKVQDKTYAYYISTFMILPKFRTKGYGSLLFDSVIDYISKLDNNSIVYLNACPIGRIRILNLEDLMVFYKKRNFISYLDKGPNVFMYKNT